MEKNDEKCICPVQELLLYYLHLLAQNSCVFLNGAKSQAMVGFAPRGFEYSHGKLTPQFGSLAQEVHWFHHRRLGGFGLRLVVSPSIPGRPGLPSGAPGGPWKVRARRCRCRGRVEGASCSKWADLVGNSSGIEVVDCCWVLIYNGLWCAWQWKITKENMGKIKNQHIFRYMGGFAARVMSTPDYLIINWGLVIINPGLTWKIPKTLDEDPYLIHCWDT